MRNSKRHVHKYYRAKVSSQTVFACALADCNHYMPNHLLDLVNGKMSICWDCGETFVLDGAAMELDKPLCIQCRTGVTVSDVDEFMRHVAEFKAKQ